MLVTGLLWVSAAAVVVMMLATCLDVLCRLVYRPITGTYDIVSIAAAIAVICTIPYTTAIKGHVAIEYFFHKLGPLGRILVDGIVRLLAIFFYVAVCYRAIYYAGSLRSAGQVSATLQLPLFWIAGLLSFCAAVTVAVILYNLFHPGREMMKP